MSTLAADYSKGQTAGVAQTGATALAATYAPLAGRAALSAIFLLSAVGKITSWDGTAGYMASKGMPLVPFFLASAIVVEALGGLSVLLGYKARWGALALAAFLVPVSLIFHNFWAFEGMARQMEMIGFLKNVAIAGGLLTVVAHGAGALSIDSKRGE